MKTDHLVKVSLLAFICLFAFASIPVSSAGGATNEGWLPGWMYRKAHVINPAPGAGVGCQVKIVVHYGSGMDHNDNAETPPEAHVYLNGKCRADFGDVRFLSETPEYYRISIDETALDDYGLGYPVIYIFDVYGANLKAYKRTGNDWVQLIEKTSDDFFNGIECVRFDYANGKAYVSIAFDEHSNHIDIQFRDSSGNVAPSAFREIAKYYDSRKCAVMVSIDDVCGSLSRHPCFMEACDAFQSRQMWLTAGLITNHGYPPIWTDIQKQVNEGFIEIASHSRTHVPLPYPDYDSEIGGSKADIIGNLTLPAIYRRGEKQYIWCWSEPGGSADKTVLKKLGEYKYLVSRTAYGLVSVDFEPWTVWNVYRSGAEGMPDNPDVEAFNSRFDLCYEKGYIYHFFFHAHVRMNFTALVQHLDYIKGKKDVWYVGMGAAFAYNYVRQNAKVSAFGSSSKMVVLDYWMERKVDRDYGVFWVKVPNDLSRNPTAIYIWYGNPSATYNGSLNKTFIRVIDSLVLSLPLDEGSGTTVYDKSGYGNKGIVYGNATWVDTPFGKGLDFDGVDDYLVIPFAPILNVQNVAIAVWARPRNITNYSCIVKKGVHPTVPFYLTTTLAGSMLRFGILADGTAKELKIDIIDIDKWYFITACYDGTLQQGLINNTQRTMMWRNVITGSLNQSKVDLYLGDRVGSGGSRFNGTIDEVRLYTFLSYDDISALYKGYPFEVPENNEAGGKTIIRKYVVAEPTHGLWDIEEDRNDSDYAVIPSNVLFGKIPRDGCYINFAQNQTLKTFYRLNNLWFFDGYGFKVHDASMTIVRFFADNQLVFTLTAPSGVSSVSQVYVDSSGIPHMVRVDGVEYNPANTKSEFDGAQFTTWYYDPSSSIVYVKVKHSNPVTVTLSVRAEVPSEVLPPYLAVLKWFEAHLFYVAIVGVAVLLLSLFRTRCLCSEAYAFGLGGAFLLLGGLGFILALHTGQISHYGLSLLLLMVGVSFLLLRYLFLLRGRCSL